MKWKRVLNFISINVICSKWRSVIKQMIPIARLDGWSFIMVRIRRITKIHSQSFVISIYLFSFEIRTYYVHRASQCSEYFSFFHRTPIVHSHQWWSLLNYWTLNVIERKFRSCKYIVIFYLFTAKRTSYKIMNNGQNLVKWCSDTTYDRMQWNENGNIKYHWTTFHLWIELIC